MGIIKVKRGWLPRQEIGRAIYHLRSKEELQQTKWLGGKVNLAAMLPVYFDFSNPNAKKAYLVVNTIVADNEKAYSKILKKLKKVSKKNSTPVILTERRTCLIWLEKSSKDKFNNATLSKAGFKKSDVSLYVSEPKGAIVTSEIDFEKDLPEIDNKNVWEYVP
ncbi:MAG: hypothetical protein GTN40_03305 [Candidatus Aenigmarchaeota archaeon]|nr:hypothetical protein [Candidatus Aenigmarchaeota archaeon]